MAIFNSYVWHNQRVRNLKLHQTRTNIPTMHLPRCRRPPKKIGFPHQLAEKDNLCGSGTTGSGWFSENLQEIPSGWWWLEHEWIIFHYMGCHPSYWRTPSFFKMVKTTNQPYLIVISLWFPPSISPSTNPSIEIGWHVQPTEETLINMQSKYSVDASTFMTWDRRVEMMRWWFLGDGW